MSPPPTKNTPNNRDDEASSAMWRASGMGAEFAFGIVGMIALGWLVDRGLDSAPVGMIVGAAMGIVGGGYNFIRQAMKMNRQAAARYRRDYPEGSPPLRDVEQDDDDDRS